MITKSITKNGTVAKTEKERNIGELILARKQWIAQALPKFLDIDRFTRICFTELRRNKQLMLCNPESLIGAMIQSAQLGLMPNSATGEAYLVPFRDECTLIIGYQGMIKLAYNSTKVTKIIARAVYKDDIFEYELGTEEHIKHIPSMAENDDTDFVCCYAIAKLANGETMFCVLSKKEIDEKHKKHSKSANGKNPQYSPWFTNYVEMAKKTCIRALAKYLPRSTEDLSMYKAIDLDERADRGEQDNSLGSVIDGLVVENGDGQETQSKADKIANEITNKIGEQNV